MSRASSLGLAFALAACSSGKTPGAVDTTEGGAGGSGGASSEALAAPVVASFVAETLPGKGPAKLRLFNDSDQTLSVTLPDGEAFAFYLVPPYATTTYLGAAVADTEAEVIVSLHTKDTCVRLHFDEIGGPQALEPGHAYTLHVQINPEVGIWAAVTEEAMPAPFTGIRALVDDPAPGSAPAPSKLILWENDKRAATPALVFDTIFSEIPEAYRVIEADIVHLASVTLVDRQGATYHAAAPISLDAHGYTVVVDDAPVEGAEVTVTLDPAAP